MSPEEKPPVRHDPNAKGPHMRPDCHSVAEEKPKATPMTAETWIRRAKESGEAIMQGRTVIAKVALSGALDDLDEALKCVRQDQARIRELEAQVAALNKEAGR